MDIDAIENKVEWTAKKQDLADGLSKSYDQIIALMTDMEYILSIIGECISDEWCEEYWFEQCYEDMDMVARYLGFMDDALTSYTEYLDDLKQRRLDIVEFEYKEGDLDPVKLEDYCPFSKGDSFDGTDSEMRDLFIVEKIGPLLSHIEYRLRDEYRSDGMRFYGFLKDIVEYNLYEIIESSLEFYSMNENKNEIKDFSQLPSVVGEMAKRVSLQYEELARQLKEQLVEFYRCFNGLFPNARRALMDHE